MKNGGLKLMTKECYNFVQIASQICQDYYPETLGSFIVINVSFILRAAWAIVKNFLNENTVAKIQILGSDYKEVLLSQIHEDNLPSFFGGKCQCVPNGCLYSNEGPWKTLLNGFPTEIENTSSKIHEFPPKWIPK